MYIVWFCIMWGIESKQITYTDKMLVHFLKDLFHEKEYIQSLLYVQIKIFNRYHLECLKITKG